MNTFENAEVNQPKAIYTDHNCFATGKVAYRLANWASQVRLVSGISCVALNKEQLVHTIHCTAHSLGDCQTASSNRTVVIMPYFWKPKKGPQKSEHGQLIEELIFTFKDAWPKLGAPFRLPTVEEILATHCRHLICIHLV